MSARSSDRETTAFGEHSSCGLADSIDVLGVGILGRDARERVRYVNDRMLRWTGYARSELICQSMSLLVPAELDQIFHAEMRAVDEGDVRARLTVLRRKDRTTFPVIAIPQMEHPRTPDAVYLAVVVELASIETAKPANSPHTGGLRSSLERISRELQTLGMIADAVGVPNLSAEREELRRLSAREREVLAELLAGYRGPAIARRLHVSPHTVRSHLKSIFRHLGVRSQSEVIDFVRSLEGRESEGRERSAPRG